MIAVADFMSAYSVKLAEYMIAGSYLVLLVPFWRYATGPRAVPAGATAKGGLRSLVDDWFEVPDDIDFHLGHAWVREEKDGEGLVTIGMDDFAQKLVGRPSRIELPPVGTRLSQGEKAWSIAEADKSVCMLSPVDCEVLARNDRILADPGGIVDPYGEGWLLKARAPRLRANRSQLNRDSAARRWMKTAADELRAKLSEGLGPMYQDGGTLMPGIARNLDPERWDELARGFFRS